MAPTGLNTAIHYTHLCKALGVTATQTHPPTAPCPLCRRGTIRVYNDAYEGHWWACDRCQYYGTTLQLYQKARSIPDVREALYSLANDCQLKLDDQYYTRDAAESQHRRDRLRANLGEFWGKCRDLMIAGPNTTVSVMTKWRLWEGGHSLQQYHSTVASVNRPLLDLVIGQLGPKHISKGYSNALIFRYELLPGRPSGFLFWASDEANVFKPLLDKEDAGLLGLSLTLKSRDVCYAVSDRVLWMHMQRRWYKDKRELLPMVCYSKGLEKVINLPQTTRSWGSLHHDKVIIWDLEPFSFEVFHHARQLGTRGYIALKPAWNNTNKPTYELLAKRTAFDVVRDWERSAVHWLEALKIHLLAASPSDAVYLLGQLNGLSDFEKDSLYKLCSEEQWRRLSLLFASDNSLRSFMYGNETFVEKPGQGWFRLNPVGTTPTETLITNAYISLTRVSDVDGDNLLSGDVLYKGNRFPFAEKETVIRKDPAHWLSRLCVSRECGIPSIDNRYRRHLLDMARAANEPRQISQVERVGWDPTQQLFMFPRFLVRNGQCELHDHSGATALNIPAANLMPFDQDYPRPSVVAHWSKPNTVMELGWAMMVALLGNLTADSAGQMKRGISVIDMFGTGLEAVTQIGESFSLTSINRVPSPSTWEMDELVRQEHKHDLPVLLRADSLTGSQWEGWARYKRPHNVIMMTNVDTACNLNLADDWLSVRADDASVTMPEGFQALSTLCPMYLKWLSTNNWQPINPDRVWPLPVLDTLFQLVYPQQLKNADEDILALKQRIEDRLIVWGPGQLWKKFMATVFCEIVRNTIQLDGDLLSKCDYNGAPYIRIRISKLMQRLARNRWYLPDPKNLTGSFAESNLVTNDGDDWLMLQSDWTQLLTEWASAYRAPNP